MVSGRGMRTGCRRCRDQSGRRRRDIGDEVAMFWKTVRPSSMAWTMEAKLSSRADDVAASRATRFRSPMATPTWAFSAGA